MDYVFERADNTGARFRTGADDRLLTVLPFAAGAGLLSIFAVQAFASGEPADRLWAYSLLALALVSAAVGFVMWRRAGVAPILRFDNASRTLRLEDAHGTLVSAVPYADIGPFEPGKYSSTSNGTSHTTYTITVSLKDGRHIRLCRDSEATRDEQLALLSRFVQHRAT